METIKLFFRDLLDTAISAWNRIMKNLGWVLSICYGGFWFAFFNGFAIPIIAIHSWFVTSILTLIVWGMLGVGIAFVLLFGFYLGMWAVAVVLDMITAPKAAQA